MWRNLDFINWKIVILDCLLKTECEFWYIYIRKKEKRSKGVEMCRMYMKYAKYQEYNTRYSIFTKEKILYINSSLIVFIKI